MARSFLQFFTERIDANVEVAQDDWVDDCIEESSKLEKEYPNVSQMHQNEGNDQEESKLVVISLKSLKFSFKLLSLCTKASYVFHTKDELNWSKAHENSIDEDDNVNDGDDCGKIKEINGFAEHSNSSFPLQVSLALSDSSVWSQSRVHSSSSE